MNAVKAQITTRALVERDFEQVVDIDANITNRHRPGFFQKRLAAALTEPKYFIYIGCELNGELKGFLMARLLEGEYGTDQPVAVLDAIGVDPKAQGNGSCRPTQFCRAGSVSMPPHSQGHRSKVSYYFRPLKVPPRPVSTPHRVT